MYIHDLIMPWNHAAIRVIDVRLMMLAAGEEWAAYRLPMSAFVYSFQGSAQIRLDGRDYAAGRFLLLHGGKGTMFEIQPVKESFAFYLIYYKATLALPFRRELAVLMERNNPFQSAFGFIPQEPVALLNHLTDVADGWKKSDSLERLRVKGSFYLFVHELLRQLRAQGLESGQPTLAKQVVRFLEQRYAEPITLERLAQQFNYSSRYLTRLVKEETAQSPIDYLIAVRIEKAKGLLQQTDASLQEVAASVGYQDVLYFSRLFKKHTGVTPGQFQSRAQQKWKSPDRPYESSISSIAVQGDGGYSVDDNDYQRAFGGIVRMNKRSTRQMAFLLLVSVALLVSACSGNTSSAPPNGTVQEQPTAKERVLTDAMGNKVTLPAHPQRVIASYLEDHLVALGVKPVAQWSVGEGQIQKYLQNELAGIPEIPHDLPPEVVMSFNPDLLIMGSADLLAGDKYDQYAKISPTYAVGLEKNNDWRKELLTVGEVLNKSEQAKEVLARYEEKAKEAKEKIQQGIGSKSAAALWVLPKSIFVVKENLSSGDVLYKDLGFSVPNVVKEISEANDANWNEISLEKLAVLDADYLFIVNSKGMSKDDLLRDPVYANIPAVKAGHVYDFTKDSSWLYTGTIANQQIIENVLESVLKK